MPIPSPSAGVTRAETARRAPAAPPLWHALDVQTVLAELGSSLDGLTPTDARRRLESHGANLLPRPARESRLTLIWRQINSPLIWVLIGAATLAFMLGKVTDGAVVLGVVVLNTLIGFVQELRAGRAIAALIELVPQSAVVLRAGARLVVPAAEIVNGDIVDLYAGDKVPADVRLLATRNLQLDEAALTGESLPVEKGVVPVAADVSLGDRRSMAYAGTLVATGTGTGVVVATGSATELGRISALLRETTRIDTPLTRQLARVADWLTRGIVAVSCLLLGVGLLRGYPWLDALLAAVTLAVAAIPEGLPAIITIALAIGVQRMARRRAVVRRLPAVETLGSTSVICSDKTGTLTRNEMTVQALWTPAGTYRLTGTGYIPHGALLAGDTPLPAVPTDVQQLLLAGVLCSDATLRREGPHGWQIAGDPTEGALVVAAAKVGILAEDARRAAPRIDVAPFESERKLMVTLHANGDRTAAYLKGAPEVVLARCDAFADGSPIDGAAVHREVEMLAREGMRVLALAALDPTPAAASADELAERGGFRLLGLQGMIDPPREEAVAAVAACHQAGIVVKMITGDHRMTAQAIAQRLGLSAAGESAVSGAELELLPDAELRALAGHTNVFARVAPEHKLRLVQALQADGEVVAMTGDGVNDAPALKRADIGVAMGIAGTAAAREAADMVLTDDNFASIVAAIEEGRRVYDNLIKALVFVLPTNLGLALILLAAVTAFPIVGGEPLLPMTPTQILWINLVATVALALPLAFEAREPDVMRRPPRNRRAPILNGFVLIRTGIVALLMAAGAVGLFLYEYHREAGAGVPHGVALAEAQSMAVTTVVFFQIFYVLNCRSLNDSIFAIGLWSNPYVYAGIVLLLLLQGGFVYLAPLNMLFHTAPLSAASVAKALTVASLILPVIGAEKALHQHGWRGLRRARRAPHQPRQ